MTVLYRQYPPPSLLHLGYPPRGRRDGCPVNLLSKELSLRHHGPVQSGRLLVSWSVVGTQKRVRLLKVVSGRTVWCESLTPARGVWKHDWTRGSGRDWKESAGPKPPGGDWRMPEIGPGCVTGRPAHGFQPCGKIVSPWGNCTRPWVSGASGVPCRRWSPASSASPIAPDGSSARKIRTVGIFAVWNGPRG